MNTKIMEFVLEKNRQECRKQEFKEESGRDKRKERKGRISYKSADP